MILFYTNDFQLGIMGSDFFYFNFLLVNYKNKRFNSIIL